MAQPALRTHARLLRFERRLAAQPPATAIGVPAHREAGFIRATIEGIATAARHTRQSAALVVLVNNSDDDTFAEARAALDAAPDLPFALVQLHLLPKGAHVGIARRAALDIAAALATEAILSTDADTRVAPDWLAQAGRSLENADLVCGAVSTDPAELAALPPSVARCGAAEAALEAALNRLWWAVTGPSPRSFTNKGTGANMAMRVAAYRQVGGLPTRPHSEDRALHDRFAAAGLRIAHDPAMRVATSCRLDRRAVGGMADCLTARALDADPPVDGQLIPARILLARAVAHRTGVLPAASVQVRPLRASEARLEALRAEAFAAAIEGGADPLTLLEESAPAGRGSPSLVRGNG